MHSRTSKTTVVAEEEVKNSRGWFSTENSAISPEGAQKGIKNKKIVQFLLTSFAASHSEPSSLII